jgi:hypothetical protein
MKVEKLQITFWESTRLQFNFDYIIVVHLSADFIFQSLSETLSLFQQGSKIVIMLFCNLVIQLLTFSACFCLVMETL